MPDLIKLIVALLLSGRGMGLNLLPNFQKGGTLQDPQFLEEGCWKRGADFFQERGGF